MMNRVASCLLGLTIPALYLAERVGAGEVILATGFFSGTIEKFEYDENDEVVQSTFATIPGNPGLSGIAYSPTNHCLYVSALNQGGVYILDADSGGVLGFGMLMIGPAGLAVSATGEVYVTDFTSNLVRIYDANLTNLLDSISVPVMGGTSGVGIAGNGDVIIATPGSGVYRYDGDSVTSFTDSQVAPLASAQIAFDSDDNVFIGHGIGFSDDAFKFLPDGTLAGFITVTDEMVDGTGFGSALGTSPGGIALDSNGDLIVAVSGRSNPGDPGGERGGMFKFDTAGNLIGDPLATGSIAFSAVVVFTPPPAATVVDSFVYHNAWSGPGSAIDTTQSLHQETGTPQTLSESNLINSSQGINGIGFDIQALGSPASVAAADFEFQMSPQGAFVEALNPPAGWIAAPAPASVAVTPGSPDRVLITWANNQIENRWLRVTIKATANTGLAQPQTYYLGHLRGKVGGPGGGIYSVGNADVSAVRTGVGQNVPASSKLDIDKNSFVNNSDISAMRAGIGVLQLRNITVP